MPVLFSALDTHSHFFPEPVPKCHVMVVQEADFSATVATVWAEATGAMLDSSAMAAMADKVSLVMSELTEPLVHLELVVPVALAVTDQMVDQAETEVKAVQSLATVGEAETAELVEQAEPAGTAEYLGTPRLLPMTVGLVVAVGLAETAEPAAMPPLE